MINDEFKNSTNKCVVYCGIRLCSGEGVIHLDRETDSNTTPGFKHVAARFKFF